jgi:hypothetical protein
MYYSPEEQENPITTPRIARWRHGIGVRAVLSLVAVCTFGAVGVFGTQAAFSDNVTMGRIHVTGGSLDMVANNDTGDSDVAWSGDLSVALTGLQPGDVKDGTVEIENAGDLPYELVTSTSGTDASGCFGYYLRETGVTGGTGASTFPVNFTGMGTDSATDSDTAAFATAVTNRALPDDGADLAWEAGDAKTYTISVRMQSSCTTNAADATLDISFDATQV